MPFKPVAPERIARSIQHQIESLILRGILRPGERLPSERDLATRLSVSRPSLREALAALETAGLIETRPGAGAYVADILGAVFAPPLVQLFSSHPPALFDFLSFRRDLEGLAVVRAAEQASDTDLQVVTSVFQKMQAAHDRNATEHEAELDAEFHMAIVSASNNVVMLHVMRSVYVLLKEGVFYNRQTMFAQSTTRNELLDQHRAIHDALIARDAVAAKQAVEAHIDFIEAAMQTQQKRERNAETASLRLNKSADSAFR